MAAAPSLVIGDYTDGGSIAAQVQRRQRDLLIASSFHVSALAKLLSLSENTVEAALQRLECPIWSNETAISQRLSLPADESELWTIVFQIAHVLEPLIRNDYPLWSTWLTSIPLNGFSGEVMESIEVMELALSLSKQFAEADEAVRTAIRTLERSGFNEPSTDHVLQIASRMDKGKPHVLLRAATGMQIGQTHSHSKQYNAVVPIAQHILPSKERLGFWGFHDTSFIVNHDEKTGQLYVSVTGDRYIDRKKRFTNLIPFVERAVGVKIDVREEREMTLNTSDIIVNEDSALGEDDIDSLRLACDAVSLSVHDRIRHGAGHSLSDVFSVRFGNSIRVPDVVVWPSTVDEIASVVTLAKKRKWCLIPFGGGTNVSRAVCCPSIKEEPRPIISVDMKKMNQLVKLDRENNLAHVQAGIAGTEMNDELRRAGYTMGHEPDSTEFSTLGGWIATKASGMKRNKYGNIEDIVTGIEVVGVDGLMMKHGHWGRESCGLDLTSLFLGSEGCLGIIVSAVVRIHRLPETRCFDAFLLPDFDTGLHLMRDFSRLPVRLPASMRLLDNKHFQLGQALRPAADSLYEKIEDAVARRILSYSTFSLEESVCLAVGYEGSKNEVREQKNMISRLVRSFGGVSLGQSAGRRAYEMTFMIAYLRDFALNYQIAGESFETFARWSDLRSIVTGTKDRVQQEHQNLNLPGKPFIGCRVTQIYSDGVCLYFYLCISVRGIQDQLSTFASLEEIARGEILLRGGSLSHHHGVGKLRAKFLNSVQCPTTQAALRKIKEALDPDNIFGAQNGQFA